MFQITFQINIALGIFLGILSTMSLNVGKGIRS
jgi:hypothetical protein